MNYETDSFTFTPIAYVQSPFKQRYGIPRQPGLVKNAIGHIQFNNDPDLISALKTMDQFSHLWIIFVFHQHGGKKWKPSIRPPRLGGRTKVGVLASRSPHRPNPIGISVVKIIKVCLDDKAGPTIEVEGLDLLDGTPVLDIKPYIPYADSISEAKAGWATSDLVRHPVHFSQDAVDYLKENFHSNPHLQDLITEILELDPRPAYLQREEPATASQFWHKPYGIEISSCEVKYVFTAEGIVVTAISSSME